MKKILIKTILGLLLIFGFIVSGNVDSDMEKISPILVIESALAADRDLGYRRPADVAANTDAIYSWQTLTVLGFIVIAIVAVRRNTLYE